MAVVNFGLSFIVVILFVSTSWAAADANLIREQNLKWVKECSQRMPATKTQQVNYKFTQLCKKPNFYYSAKSNFYIKNINHQISLNYKIRLKILPAQTTNQEARDMLRLARSCVPSIQNVWERYGVTINLDFDSDRETQSTAPNMPMRTINFFNYDGPGNAENFYKIKEVHFCKVIASALNRKNAFPTVERNCIFATRIFGSDDFYRVGSEIFQIMKKSLVFGHSPAEQVPQ